MAKWIHPLKVFIDPHGALEIEGLENGTSDADRIGEELDIEKFTPLDLTCSCIRADGLDEAARQRVVVWAKEHEWELVQKDDLGKATWSNPDGMKPHASTVDTVLSHSMGPSVKEKAIVPIVLIVAVLILGGIGMVAYDHANERYRTAATLGDVVAFAAMPLPERGGLAGLLDPVDEQFLAVEIRNWSYWCGKGAVTGDQYVYLPDIKGNVEDLVKGDRGNSSGLVFRFDIAKSTPPEYHVIEIERGGMTPVATNLTMVIHALTAGAPPVAGEFTPDRGVKADDRGSWRKLENVESSGFLFPNGDGYRIRSRSYAMDLEAPGREVLTLMLQEAALNQEEIALYPETVKPRPKVSLPSAKRINVMVNITELGDGGDGVIGKGTIAGVKFGGLYVEN